MADAFAFQPTFYAMTVVVASNRSPPVTGKSFFTTSRSTSDWMWTQAFVSSNKPTRGIRGIDYYTAHVRFTSP